MLRAKCYDYLFFKTKFKNWTSERLSSLLKVIQSTCCRTGRFGYKPDLVLIMLLWKYLDSFLCNISKTDRNGRKGGISKDWEWEKLLKAEIKIICMVRSNATLFQGCLWQNFAKTGSHLLLENVCPLKRHWQFLKIPFLPFGELGAPNSDIFPHSWYLMISLFHWNVKEH